MRLSMIFLVAIIITACQGNKNAETSINKVAYQLEIDNWHKKRIEDLKDENGWLNLAGLFWLNEGINTFGSDANSTLVFPEGKIEKRAGFFLLKQGVVTLEVAPKVSITIDGKPVARTVVFHPDSTKRTVMESGSLRWFVIKREDKIGIRLRDLQSKELTEFNGIERYPVNSAWRVEAAFEKGDSLKTIPITNVLGQTFDQPSPGTLVFKINNKEYRLDAIDEGGDELFIIYGDDTNGKTTYGAGRYLYVKKPKESSTIILDFNKGYNPPCAFTAFATCPLPPRQNVLSVPIEAGEKNYGIH